MHQSSEIYHMSFDQLWNHCKVYRRNYEELSEIISYLNGLGNYEIYKLFNEGSQPQKVSFMDILWSFQAYLTCIEGDFSKAQIYKEGKVRYHARMFDLNEHYEEQFQDIKDHNTIAWRNMMKQVVKAQSTHFCQQLAKYGLVFLAPSQTSFTNRQYNALKYLYDYNDILLNV